MSKTVFKTKKTIAVAIIMIGIAVSVLLTGICPVSAAEEDSPPAAPAGLSYIVYECDTKQTLLKQNAELTADCSLLARLMTCMLVLENTSVTYYVTPTQDSTSAYGWYTLQTSNKYTIESLLTAVILCNADNAARELAEYVNPNPSYFVSLMNQKAAELGMSNTYFRNVDGSADTLQRTTAYDMCLFMSYAMTNSQFRAIASNGAAHIWEGIAVINECKMVADNMFKDAITTAGAYSLYDNINKFGTTFFYINQVSENAPSTQLVLILAGTAGTAAAELGKYYIDTINKTYKKEILVHKDQTVVTTDISGNILYLNASENSYCMKPTDVASYIENVSYNVTYHAASAVPGGKIMSLDELTPPIDEGAVIGTANYILKDGSVHAVTLIAGNSIHSDSRTINTFYKMIKENTDIFILISVLVAFEILLAIIIIISKIRNKSRIKY